MSDIDGFISDVSSPKRRRDAETLLGPHTTGVGCIYLKDLEQNDLDALRRIVARSYATLTSGVFGGPAKA